MATNTDELFGGLFDDSSVALPPLVHGVDMAALETKVVNVFGNVSIDKRRLTASM